MRFPCALRTPALAAIILLGAGMACVAVPATADSGSGTTATTETFGPGDTAWTVPQGVHQISAEIYGGAGGPPVIWDGVGYTPGTVPGGKGAHVHAVIPVTPGQTVHFIVGTAGPVAERWADGWNQGGYSQSGGMGTNSGGNGGGASGVVIGTTTLAVAGAGGGASGRSFATTGGDGGDSGTAGTKGGDYTIPAPYDCQTDGGVGGLPGLASAPGTGGSGGQTTCPLGEGGPGADGYGGDGSTGGGAAQESGAAGGGGGWRGGGAGGGGAHFSNADQYGSGDPNYRHGAGGGGGGGGGSSYLDPTLTDGSIVNGARSGDGEIDISYEPLGPDITSGPDARTNSRDASLTFNDPSSDPSNPLPFDCSLDGTNFTPCSSPAVYQGLADGSHRFSVRVHPSGPDEPPVSTWTWTVDTAPPHVIIDSAPSGTVASSSASVSFHGDKPNLAFTCGLDGGAMQPCSSPFVTSGLANGPHAVAISAADDLGNASAAPAQASWTVDLSLGSGANPGSGAAPGGSSGSPSPPTSSGEAPATPPSSCAPPQLSRATIGVLSMVARGGTCLHTISSGGNRSFTSSGPVTVDGISVTPDPGVQATLSAAASGGELRTSGPATLAVGSLGAVHVPFGIAWSQDLSGALTTANRAYSLVSGSIAGLPAVPGTFPDVSLSKDNGGQATIALPLKLPDIFSAIPGAPSSVGVELAATVSNDNGLTLGGKISVGSLYLGALHLEDLEIAYDGQHGSFAGSVGVQLGAGPKLVASITLGPPSIPPLIGCCVDSVGLVVQDINRPIPNTPLFLQSIGGGASRDAGPPPFLVISGSVGLSLGPKLPRLGAALSFSGGVELSLSTPWKLSVSGKASVFNFPLAGAKATYTYGGAVTAQGKVDMTIGGYGLSAGISNTFFAGADDFNIQADGTISFPGLGAEHANAVFSSHGLAACSTIHSPLGDYAIGWGVDASGTQTVLSDNCDLGPFSVSAGTAARAAAGPRTLQLGRGSGPRLLAVQGFAHAPQVTVTGPGGVSLSTHQHGPSAWGAVITDESRATTFVVLASSRAGRYVIAGTGIRTIKVAMGLPPARPRVHAQRLFDGRIRLRFSAVPGAGALELYEIGKPGTGHLLLRTTRTHGTLTYRPAPGLGGVRHIVAVTLNHGRVRDRRTLATYRVDDAPPAAVRHVRRHGSRLSWKAPARADGYVVAFALRARTVTRFTLKPVTWIPTGTRSVLIVALDALSRPGRPVKVTLVRLP